LREARDCDEALWQRTHRATSVASFNELTIGHNTVICHVC
jgi:hypothetical protein